MTNVHTIPYMRPYGVCNKDVPALKSITKPRKKVRKENAELIFLITLLTLGNIIAICKSASFSLGLFGCFLGSVLLISLAGIVFGAVKGLFRR